MAIFWTALPMLLLLAVIFLDIYVFRGQWKDEPQTLATGRRLSPHPRR